VAWLVRLILGALAWRVARARRTGQPVVDMSKLRRRAGSAREGAGIAVRLLVVVVLAAFCAGLVAAGSTALALGPRWLGGLLIGAAAVIAAVTVPEIVSLRRTVQRRRQRRRARELGQEVERGAE
jgi:MFS family permease